jgi:hypothetical protein
MGCVSTCLSYCSHKVCLTSTYNKYISFLNNRIEWAVRGLSFGCQSQLIALASEDPYIEIAKVDTGIDLIYSRKFYL